MVEVEMRKNGDLIFITGLKAEPRVFDFEVGKEVDSVIVADKEVALGELALLKDIIFAQYSDRAVKRLRRILKLSSDTGIDELGRTVVKRWKKAV
jgi:hypothetical protein